MTEPRTEPLPAGAGVDRGAVTPLYEQIAQILRGEIAGGRYDAGPLPSESALQRRFCISRVTARQSLRKLADEGLVEARRGRGTFVAQARIRHALGTARGFYDELLGQGIVPQTRLAAFERREPPAGLPAALTTYLERHYALDGEPLAVAVSWLPAAALDAAPGNAAGHTIYGLVEDVLGHRVAAVDTAIGAAPAEPHVAAALGLAAGALALTLARQSRDAAGAPCEASVFHLRPDRYEFVLRTEGPLQGAHARIRGAAPTPPGFPQPDETP